MRAAVEKCISRSRGGVMNEESEDGSARFVVFTCVTWLYISRGRRTYTLYSTFVFIGRFLPRAYIVRYVNVLSRLSRVNSKVNYHREVKCSRGGPLECISIALFRRVQSYVRSLLFSFGSRSPAASSEI